jgi:hypothetical protein
MPPALRLALLALIPMSLVAQESHPQFLDIVQERLKPNALAKYSRIEEEAARVCARLCPNSYLALESMTGPKAVWWFNGYAAEADRDSVKLAYERDSTLMAELAKVLAPKKRLVSKPKTVETRYRPELSDSSRCAIGGARFFVITVSSGPRKADACVFEDPDGRHFIIVPAKTRREAAAIARLAGPRTTLFAVRPSWSKPTPAWVAADAEFWRTSP